jgi:hypothetical protein
MLPSFIREGSRSINKFFTALSPKYNVYLMVQILFFFLIVKITRSDTGRFIMFSVITNIYNKKTKGPTFKEFFRATGKLKEFFLRQLEIFDVCTTGDTARIDKIFKLLPHTLHHVDACVART